MSDPVIPRPAPDEHAPCLAGSVDLVPGDDALAPLRTQLAETLPPLEALGEAASLRRCAKGKWSVKEVVGHGEDMERIVAYRALRLARADRTPLPGFERDDGVPAGRFDARPRAAALLDEWRAVRAATVAPLASLDGEALTRAENAAPFDVTVRAIAGLIARHERHHRAVLRERYGVGRDA